jgi:hypothetical protein
LVEKFIGENVQNLDVWHVACKHQTHCSKHVQCTNKEHGAKVFFSLLDGQNPSLIKLLITLTPNGHKDKVTWTNTLAISFLTHNIDLVKRQYISKVNSPFKKLMGFVNWDTLLGPFTSHICFI